MTLEQRNAAILKMMAEQTRRETASVTAARAALAADGTYTAKGRLRVKFGGTRVKVAAGS